LGDLVAAWRAAGMRHRAVDDHTGVLITPKPMISRPATIVISRVDGGGIGLGFIDGLPL
jgi:hypothetical protein